MSRLVIIEHARFISETVGSRILWTDVHADHAEILDYGYSNEPIESWWAGLTAEDMEKKRDWQKNHGINFSK
jgi:hypothetical protein